MSVKSAHDCIGDYEGNETLYSFSKRKPALFYRFVRELNKNELWKKLADVAFEKRILPLNDSSMIYSNSSGAIYFLNEFMKKNFTVRKLYECLINNEFRHLVKLLEVYDKIHIIKQPGLPGTPHKTWAGEELKLTFLVQGYPIPTYQWFHNGLPMKCENDSTLTLSHFGKEMEGEYHCVAEQSYLNLPTVSLISDPVECVLILEDPRLLLDLPPQIDCFENDEVKLSVQPDEGFYGRYEWMCGNKILPSTNSNVLHIKRVTKNQEGVYRCVLRNSAGEKFSSCCHLKVEPPLRIQAKMALLIGNSNYTHMSKLKTPSADVKLLAKCLKKMGFFVVSLTELNHDEFNYIFAWFNSIIPRKAVVFFFFSGHGFELANNKFLLPVDCPPSHCYKISDCICYQYIIQQIINRKPLLLISVLDMCLKGPDRMNNPRLYYENIEHYDYNLSNASIIEACATSDYQLAYERNSDTNGFYCRCLCDHIIQNLPIVKNFERAHEEFFKKGQCNNQRPQLKYNNGQSDLRLTSKPNRDSAKMESKIVRSAPDSFIVNLQAAGIYLLFVFVPDELILNSIDIFILPLSEFKELNFCLVCLEAKFNYVGALSKKNEALSCLKFTINGLSKIEAMRKFSLKCCVYSDKEQKNIVDNAEIKIKPQLVLNTP